MGTRSVLFFFAALLLLVFFSGGLSWAQEAEGFDFWTEFQTSYRVGKSPWTVVWATENRFDQNGTHYYLFNTTAGFHYRLTEWFRPGFRYRVEKAQDQPWENRPTPEAIFLSDWGPLKIANRHLFENRIFPHDYRFRYRMRITVGPFFEHWGVTFYPFVANEIFVETRAQNGGFNQNRVFLGHTLGLHRERYRWTLYYMLLKQKGTGGWEDKDVLGTIFSVNF